jgi:hypothetical protein
VDTVIAATDTAPQVWPAPRRDRAAEDLRPTRRRPGLLVVIVAAGAVGALAAGPAPAVTVFGNVAATTCFAALTVVMAARGRWPAWLAASAVAGATAPALGVVAAAAAGGLAVLSTRLPVRARPIAGALIGAVVVQVVLRLPGDRLGLNLGMSAVATGLLVVSGVRGRTRGSGPRRRVWRAAGGAAAVVGVGIAATVLLARAELQSGIRHAEAGLAAAQGGHGAVAADHLDAARSAFAAAHRHLDAWWAQPARSTPVLGQQMRAVSEVSDIGAELAATVGSSVRESRVDDLRVVDGRVDLVHLRSMATPLGAVEDALTKADELVGAVDHAWLLPPVLDRFAALSHTLDRARADAVTASDTIAVLPRLLGAEGRRFYFVAFGTPAEARELGGFMGAYAVLVADGGRLSLAGTGRVRDLNRAFKGKQLIDLSEFPPQFLAMQPQKYWQNVTSTADFPTVAEAVRQLWPSKTLPPLDGVLYLDPVALSAMLELTGPVRLSGLAEPLTAKNAAAFLLRDQYVKFPDDDRHDFLLEAGTAVFKRLTTGDLPGPAVIADALGPSAAHGRLLFHSFVADEQQVIEDLGFGGVFPPVRGDFLSVRASNRGLNKVDAMVQRSLDYDVNVDSASGAVRATLEVTLRNDTPTVGLPSSVVDNRIGRPSGTSSTTVSVFTPFELVRVTQAGEELGWAAVHEYDRPKYSVLVDVPPQSEVTLRFVLRGRLDVSAGYHLDVVPQALVNADELDVRVYTEGRRVGGAVEPSLDGRMSVDIPVGRFR